MIFTPNSRVHLLDVPLNIDYKNVLHFRNLQNQINYFQGRIKHTFNEVTYLRKDNVISVDKQIDSLWNVNYVMYQNTDYGNKWFFAFITKMEYVNERVTNIFIESDVYQTWLFEATLKTSFVVREHVSDDTIGRHIVDEGLETGEYKMYNWQPTNKLGVNWNILAVSDNTPMGSSVTSGNVYGNVVTGLTYYPFPNTLSGVSWLRETISKYTDAGKEDAIAMIFTVPRFVLRTTIDDGDWQLGGTLDSGSNYDLTLFEIPKNHNNLDGYVPKNKKMFTFPYNFLYFSNVDGGSATFKYEGSSEPTMEFGIIGSVTPNPKLLLAPFNYMGQGLITEYGFTLSGYPLGSWSSDAYNAWFAQNGIQTGVAMVAGMGSTIAGAVTGNPLLIMGGIGAVASSLSKVYVAEMQPDTAKGQTGSGNLMYASNSLDFHYGARGIKKENAKIIDDFFSMYGYKVNALKVPEITSRQNWNYIQTIDVNIEGSIPFDDMEKLRKIYNSGVTLWHNVNNFLNYSVSNSIV